METLKEKDINHLLINNPSYSVFSTDRGGNAKIFGIQQSANLCQITIPMDKVV